MAISRSTTSLSEAREGAGEPTPDRGYVGVTNTVATQFVAVEELFTRFEHYASLAQIALEDLQVQLADLREFEPIGVDPADLPENVLPFMRH